MISDVDICNMALREIGAKTISDLSESSQPARDCSLYYAVCRLEVLRARPWGFAQRRIQMAPVTVPDAFSEWAYAYGYPADCLEAVAVKQAGSTASWPFQVATDSGVKIILSQVSEAVLVYTVDVTNEAEFDEDFVDALALRLSANLAQSLFKNAKLKQQQLALFQAAVASAVTADNRETHQKDARLTPSFQARMNLLTDVFPRSF